MSKPSGTKSPASSPLRQILDSINPTSPIKTTQPGLNTPADVAPERNKHEDSFTKALGKHAFPKPPRILVIGAGSRGNAYACSTLRATNAVIAAVCEPIEAKRNAFGRKYIWGQGQPTSVDSFMNWRVWVAYEKARRVAEANGEGVGNKIDAVYVCVLDEMHEEVLCGIADLRLHVCCEKPMSTSLESCVRIYRALKGASRGDAQMDGVEEGSKPKESVFGICHVLRYSQHNMMLRHLLLEKQVIGDVLSIEHVEPVGWWHFSHSYVRGNWRKEATSGPSLLTKSCHDIDFLMWMLCSPPSNTPGAKPHVPSLVSSTGNRTFFRKERKPNAAGTATNCMSCAHEPRCDYSAKNIYLDNQLKHGNRGWPVKIVNYEIEDIWKAKGEQAAAKALLDTLSEDYTADTPESEVEARAWYGRCVWEADNDVCDDQVVTIQWDEDAVEADENGQPMHGNRGAKTAQFHMIAFTKAICARRGRIYGTEGEIVYDSKRIRVRHFRSSEEQVHEPHMARGGHGGGDEGLCRGFLMAAEAVDSGTLSVAEAQAMYLGCDLDEAFRSHAMVFAAEEARNNRVVVDWKQWWDERVQPQLHGR